MAKADKPQKPKPRNDAYTGMLVLSLIVLVVGCVLLYLDYNQYPTSKPENPAKVNPVSNPLAPK
jgi:hypothetical protein